MAWKDLVARKVTSTAEHILWFKIPPEIVLEGCEFNCPFEGILEPRQQEQMPKVLFFHIPNNSGHQSEQENVLGVDLRKIVTLSRPQLGMHRKQVIYIYHLFRLFFPYLFHIHQEYFKNEQCIRTAQNGVKSFKQL